MSAIVHGGPRRWEAERDDEGYRTYKVTWLIKAAVDDSPVAVMNASGLPTIGSPFSFTGYSGTDTWAWCRPEMRVRIATPIKDEPAQFYEVEQVFSNKININGKSRRCQDTPIEDPLLEPMRISGGFSNGQVEIEYDMDGNKIVTSAAEPIRGAGVTFDYARPSVRIEQNVASLGLSTFAGMVNCVNASPLWGCPAYCVRLMNAPWERKVWGSCGFYYTRSFEFEVDNYNHDPSGNQIGFDRVIWDVGNKCLLGHWGAGSEKDTWVITAPVTSTAGQVLTLPASTFINFPGKDGSISPVHLDGYGRPANQPWKVEGGSSGTGGAPYWKPVAFYRAVNFLTLGIPTTL